MDCRGAELPGVLTYGASREEVVTRGQALSLRVMADRLEHGEDVPQVKPLFGRENVGGEARIVQKVVEHTLPSLEERRYEDRKGCEAMAEMSDENGADGLGRE